MTPIKSWGYEMTRTLLSFIAAGLLVGCSTARIPHNDAASESLVYPLWSTPDFTIRRATLINAFETHDSLDNGACLWSTELVFKGDDGSSCFTFSFTRGGPCLLPPTSDNPEFWLILDPSASPARLIALIPVDGTPHPLSYYDE